MNAATGEWHLQRMVIRYSETGGASLGVRFLFKNLLPRWKMRNPQVEVVTQHSQYEHPEMLCQFRYYMLLFFYSLVSYMLQCLEKNFERI